MHLWEAIAKAEQLIAEGKALGKDTRPLEEKVKVLEVAFRQSDHSDKYKAGGTVGMAESNPSPDQISQWRLSQLAKRNMAIQIYSELLGCSFWLCSNETMALQIKEDDPEAITYTADEMRELIRLNPTPEDIRCIHNVKTVFNGSRMAEKEW